MSGSVTIDGDTGEGEGDRFPSAEPETLLADETEPADPGLSSDAHADDPTHIGRFVVLRRIGEGGMGIVYAAYDNELDRRLAIKLVHRARARGDHQGRVRREGQAMARLSHPNVVQVYEVGEHEQQVFVAMEFVTGPTLAEWSKTLPASPTRWRSVLDKYIEVGRGLEAAHAARLVHRDFKPANAIVGDDGRVRVLDFGIARAAESTSGKQASESSEASESTSELDVEPRPEAKIEPRREGSGSGRGEAKIEPRREGSGSGRGEAKIDPLATPLTRTGALLGTPAYMSPEQFERGSVDARSDQFSFCVALYEALYGERPFAGTTTSALMFALISGEIRAAPGRTEVPSWVREILVRGLATNPAARWPSMTELLDALGRDPARRRRRQLRTTVLASFTTLAVLGSVWFSREQMHNADTAEAERELAREQEAIAQQHEAEAEAERDRALHEAQASAVRASDTARVLAAQGLLSRPDMAAALLRDAESPAQARGWRSAAVSALQRPLSHRVLRGHTNRIAYLDVSADGRFIATASFDGTARLWPTGDGPPIVLEHDDAVISASFDRQAQRLVTASRDGIAKVWQLPGKDAAHVQMPKPIVLTGLTGHRDVIWSAQFSFDGSKVVTAGRDGSVRVWPVDAPSREDEEQPGEPAAQVLGAGIDDIVWWAEFSPDGEWVLAAYGSGTASVWLLSEPERPAMQLVGHEGSVGDAHFAPTMNVIATASADGNARLFHFDPKHRGPVEAHAILEHDNEVIRVLFGPEGLRVVTASRDMTAKVWTLDDLGELAGPARVYEAERDTGPVWAADFSPDGTLLALGLGGGTVQVNSLRGGPSLLLTGHTSDAFRVRFAPDGRSLISGSSDGTARVWNTDFHAAARVLEGDGGRNTALEQRGRVLVSAAHEGSVQMWPVADAGLGPVVGEDPVTLAGHVGRPVVALDRFPRLLATADSVQAQVRVWPITGTWILDRERPKATLATGGQGVRALALDGDGELLAGLLMDGTLALWRLGDTPSEPVRLREYGRTSVEPSVLAFSPDGRTLASIVEPYTLAVWDRSVLLTATPSDPPQPTLSFEGHRARVQSLSFSPDGRRVVTAGLDHTARVSNLDATADAPLVLEHGYFVHAAAFDPAGRRLLTACGDTHAYLWDLDAPSEPKLLTGATGEIRDVEFSPDGKLAAAASMDGTLHIWPVSPNSPMDGGEPIELVAGVSLNEVEFVDGGRRIAAAGGESKVWLWYLGENLEVDYLQQQLRMVTEVCPSPSERMQFIGESLEVATAASAACGTGG